MPVGLQIAPDVDPYDDREPLWVRGGFQLIAFIASALPNIQNKEQITGLVLQVINALVPTLLEVAMPDEKRGKIVSLLRFCGYKDFADQLLLCWAEADAAIARAQIEMLPQQSSSGQ